MCLNSVAGGCHVEGLSRRVRKSTVSIISISFFCSMTCHRRWGVWVALPQEMPRSGLSPLTENAYSPSGSLMNVFNRTAANGHLSRKKSRAEAKQAAASGASLLLFCIHKFVFESKITFNSLSERFHCGFYWTERSLNIC